MKETELKPCERCGFYDEDRDNQPCCSCIGQNFVEAETEPKWITHWMPLPEPPKMKGGVE